MKKTDTPENTLVSVITVTFNSSKHLEQTILSVINQSYSHIEYLIIDGGSTDGTLELIKKYETQIDYWISEPDEGIYDAMNKGVALAKGDLVALLNSDDFYEPDAIQQVVSAYRKSTRNSIIYGHTRILQEDLGLDYIMTAHEDHWKGMGFSHSAMFIPQTVYQQIGEYNRRYSLAADYDYLLRALHAGTPTLGVDGVLSNYRNTGLSASNLAKVLGEMRYINRVHFSFFSTAHLKFLLLRYVKSMLLIKLQVLIGLCGEKPLRAAKQLYTKIFFAHK